MEGHKLLFAGAAIALVSVVVGASMFSTPRAAAQTAWRECIVARQESLDTNDSGAIQGADRSRTIVVPPGWVPVGGGGPEGSRDGWLGSVILCRH